MVPLILVLLAIAAERVLESRSRNIAALPSIKSFTVSVGRDGAATLGWRTSGATQVQLDGQPVAASGQRVLQVTAPTTMV